MCYSSLGIASNILILLHQHYILACPARLRQESLKIVLLFFCQFLAGPRAKMYLLKDIIIKLGTVR